MVGTLMKHEWLRNRRDLALFGGILVLVLLVSWGMRAIGISLLYALGTAGAVLAVSGLFMAPPILTAVDYARSSYGRIGYFTQTLPVKSSTIFGVKALWGFLVWVVSSLAGVLLGSLVGIFPKLSDLFQALGQYKGGIAPLLIFALLTMASYLLTFYGAVTLGYDPKFLRLGNAGWVVGYVIIYLASQVIGFLGLLIPFALIFDGNGAQVVHQPFLTTAGFNDAVTGMPLGVVLIPLIQLAILIPMMIHCWNKRISLR